LVHRKELLDVWKELLVPQKDLLDVWKELLVPQKDLLDVRKELLVLRKQVKKFGSLKATLCPYAGITTILRGQ